MRPTTDIQITNHFGLRPDGTNDRAFSPGLKKNILRSGKVKYFFSGDALNLIQMAVESVKKILDCASTTDKEKIRPGEKDVYLKESFIQVPGQENGYSLFAPRRHLPGTNSPDNTVTFKKGKTLSEF
jgi:hypothetical protein